jgi:protein TonB
MADKQKRPPLSRLIAIACGLVLMVGFVLFVRAMMASSSGKQDRRVQIVQVIRLPPPPPPPPEQPPPPEKTEEPLPKDLPEPAPHDEPPPAGPMGLDAQGSAGDDAFGLAARHGGSDLIGGGNGNAIFAWYTNRLKDAVVERLESDGQIGTKRYSLSVRVWIESDGRIKQVKLATTTGDSALDRRIEADLSANLRLADAPPLEMPQPITLKIVSRG